MQEAWVSTSSNSGANNHLFSLKINDMKYSFVLLILIGLYSFEGAPSRRNIKTITVSGYADPDLMIMEGQSLLEEGDLIVRLNRDPTSQLIRNFNRHDKTYSHAGVVFYENGYPFIFHIVNGEENPGERLRKDSLGRFCNPRKNAAFGIYRYDMSNNEKKLFRELIHLWYDQGLQFDPVFNPDTDDKMYCSEMIRKALIKATAKRISIEMTKLTAIEAKLFSTYAHLPLAYTSKLQIVSIDNLYTNRFCHLVKNYDYQK
jgi:hypothetical protein